MRKDGWYTLLMAERRKARRTTASGENTFARRERAKRAFVKEISSYDIMTGCSVVKLHPCSKTEPILADEGLDAETNSQSRLCSAKRGGKWVLCSVDEIVTVRASALSSVQ
jgi:hypothetical protein